MIAKTDVKYDISKNIKYLLVHENISRKQVCKDLNIKYTTFCDWVNGKTTPNHNSVEQLASYFNVEIWDMYGDVEKALTEQNNRIQMYANELTKGKVLDMSILETLDDEQIRELIDAGFRFRHRTLEEYVANLGRPLKASPEIDFGAPVGNEIW